MLKIAKSQVFFFSLIILNKVSKLNAKLSKLLHENSNLTRLEKLELVLLEQHEYHELYE